MIKFIHCADLHLGVSFKGLKRRVNDKNADLFAKASIESWNNIVALAIKESINFILIAGDIFDSINPSLQAKMSFKNGLDKLNQHNIKAFIVTGNHDNNIELFISLNLSDNCKIFSSKMVEEEVLQDEKVVIYGISHDENNYKEILAEKFIMPKKDDYFSIGLLHANIGSSTSDDSYSSTNLSALSNTNIDYWALGHIHNSYMPKDSLPMVVYSGSPQGLNINQDSPKGCFLIELSEHKTAKSKFFTTSTINFLRDELDLSKIEKFDDFNKLLELKKDEYSKLIQGAKLLFLELILSGRSKLNSDLRSEHIDELMLLVNQILGDKILLNSLTVNTLSVVDELDLIKNNPVLGDILSDSEELKKALEENLEEEIKLLKKKLIYLDNFSEEECSEILSTGKFELLNFFGK